MSSGGPLQLLLHIPAGFRPSAALWNAITGAAKEVGRAAETGAGRFAPAVRSSRRARHATGPRSGHGPASS